MNNRSVCTRCGKQRVVVSTYEEKVEKSTVTYTITGCSDPECQKLVEKGLKMEQIKRDTINREKAARDEQRLKRKLDAKKINS